jgi:transposase
MSEIFRPRRDFKGLEARRKRAAGLFASGKDTQAQIARKLGVSRTSVHRWHLAWQKNGFAGLRRAGRAGRKPRLDREDLRELDRALREGAVAHGFSTELWTLPRVARVIEKITGVHYHPGHVWRILRALDWTLQRPARRAKERNESLIQRWVSKDWPRVKKTPADGGPGSFSRTRAASPTGRQSAGPGRRKG